MLVSENESRPFNLMGAVVDCTTPEQRLSEADRT